ncbi:MAG: hypothetical protein H6500_00540 [Candidatus Woesearchaeota archaeon]|nr:hypothetical protein [Nanoarchaeota archaeon]USN44320.1 MAG: hypothetical protein H6500_00540 [Candidatus Woesearchaeota archaeon]
MGSLDEYIAELRRTIIINNVPSLCLDIDDTIAGTNLFWAEKHIEMFGSNESLTSAEIVRKYGLVKNVPYWNFKESENWILNQLYKVGLTQETKPIIDSLQELERIQEKISLSFYLTTRPISTAPQTRNWLTANSFPDIDIISVPENIILELFGFENSMHWKAKVLESFYPEVQGIIEDNHELLDYLSPNYAGKVYLLSNTANLDQKLSGVKISQNWSGIRREILATDF